MRGFKILDRFKSTQIHALCPPDIAKDGGKTNSNASKSKLTNPILVAQTLLSYGLPKTDLLEPPIDPHLKPINFVESLAELHRLLQTCPRSDKSLLYIEQYAILAGLNDPKLLRRCLCSARQHAFDVHSKAVLSAWLRFERREDELEGVSPMDCSGYILECPKAALISGYDLNSISDHCQCCQDRPRAIDRQILGENECLGLEENGDFSFCIDGEEIYCFRFRIAALSIPLKAMLYGSFVESKRGNIEFSRNEISVEGMRALEVYSRITTVELFSPEIVLELLHFANRFCCEELKSECDAHLASLVETIEDALILMDYGLEETAHLLVASCLQVFLREIPNSLFDSRVMNMLCCSEYMEKLKMVGHASFLLYYFLSQVAMEENIVSNTTVMLIKKMCECAGERWQKALAMHQLGCVMLHRNEYISAQSYFEAAARVGHTYSLAGIARSKYKQGQQNSAYRLVNSLVFQHKPAGWMYQERSLYSIGKEKIVDLNTSTELDPTLSFPYKYRAVVQLEEKQIRMAISEIEKIIGFMLSPDCLELRAWFFIALEDYESALTDFRALLTLEPNYKTLHGRLNGDHLVELLSCLVHQQSQADCCAKLYERWSSVDDIGSLAVVHQMLANDPGKSLLRFRQSLLLLRLNCQKAAMRCLRLARNHSCAEHERLIYEGWILYDTSHREDALSKADASILIQRSFEAFFLKAYILADAALDAESAYYIIHLLEEALRCPSDVLRKGQALNNLGSIFVDCGKLDKAADCYSKALNIKHTRAHQGFARIYHLRNQRKAAYDEMTKLLEKAHNNASAYEKRSEYCDRDMAKNDLNMATQLDPLRTYPYRYRAAVSALMKRKSITSLFNTYADVENFISPVLMDNQKDMEAVEELSKAIAFKPELQMLYLRAAFYDSMGDLNSALQDCEAALCLDHKHLDTLDLYNRTRVRAAANLWNPRRTVILQPVSKQQQE